MISTPNLQQAKNQIKNSKEKQTIVKSQNPEFDRKILEYGKFQILLDIHNTKGKNKIKKIESGLNHVMAKIAAKNKVAIGMDLKKLRSLPKEKKARALTSIIQNIKICRKARCSLALVNYKDKTCGFNFLISLGASTSQAREATTF